MSCILSSIKTICMKCQTLFSVNDISCRCPDEMSNLVFWKQIRRNITNTSSAALAKRIVRVKMSKNIMNATMPLKVISLKTEYPRANESRLYYEHSELRTRPSSIRQGKIEQAQAEM